MQHRGPTSSPTRTRRQSISIVRSTAITLFTRRIPPYRTASSTTFAGPSSSPRSAQRYTANALSSEYGSRAGTATFRRLRLKLWWKNEAGHRHHPARRIYAHRIVGRSGNISFDHWSGVHSPGEFATTLPDRIASAEFVSGSAAWTGPDRERRQRFRLSAAKL